LQRQNATFLTLVPEMRNRIYEQTLIESETEINGVVRSFDFLPLAQVCQQIRQEYRPLYIRNHCTRYNISYHLVVPWLNAFHPGWNDPKVSKSDITVDLHVHDIFGLMCENFPYLDLLRLRAEAPRFNLFVDMDMMGEARWQHEAQQINDMFRCRDAWAKVFADGTVKDVKFIDYDFGIQGAEQLDIVIVLAKDFTAPWLKFQDASLVKIDYHGAVAFLKSLGFKQPTHYRRAHSTVSLGLQDDGKSVGYQILGPRRSIHNPYGIICMWDAREYWHLYLSTPVDD
jgi:hypothetical protein